MKKFIKKKLLINSSYFVNYKFKKLFNKIVSIYILSNVSKKLLNIFCFSKLNIFFTFIYCFHSNLNYK